MNNCNSAAAPLFDISAEKAVLGAVMIDWNVLGRVRTKLKPEHFSGRETRVVYETMLELFNKDIVGDLQTIISYLMNNPERLKEAGGIGTVSDLTSEMPSSANIDYYVERVLSFSKRRQIVEAAENLASSAYEIGRDVNEIVSEAEEKIFRLNETGSTTEIRSMKSIIPEVMQKIEERYKNQSGLTGIPSGIPELDRMTNGFQDSNLIIIGARPSIGKTAIAVNMMEHIAVEKKIPCGFFSLEMPDTQIVERLSSMKGRIDSFKIKTGRLSIPDLKNLNTALGKIFEGPLYVVDQPNMKLLDLKAMARRMVKENGVKIIFIDYMGLITPENRQSPGYEQMSLVSKTLKTLARELEIPVIALVQLNRDAEGQEPSLNQIRGSGSIEQDADVVMFLHRDRKPEAAGEDGVVRSVNNDPQDAKLIVAKQRNGMTGEISLKFFGKYTLFEEAA